jgi:nucleoside-diphosphate kinase
MRPVETTSVATPAADQRLDTAERTLVVFKPDAVRRRLVGVLIKRFENIGLDLILASRRTVNTEFVLHHHNDLLDKYGRRVADAVATYMTSGPLVATIWEGTDAAAAGRRLIGPTFPAQAPPGSIRGDYAHFSLEDIHRTGRMSGNLVHGSRTAAEAQREISLWFQDA